MATKKITELTAVTTPTGADIFPIVQNGVTYRATRAQNASKGADIASAATTDIGAATGEYVEITGTVTITALGTVAAGTKRIVRFTGALTLTHNATSLILPNATNITTIANDCGIFISLGSGNWICIDYNGIATNAQALAGTITNLPIVPSSLLSVLESRSHSMLSVTAAGTNTYTATLSPVPAAYVSGLHYFVTFTNENTANSTLNLNSLGAKTIKTIGGFTLRIGSIKAGHAGILKYDGTDIILLNPVMTKPSFSVNKDGTNQTGIGTNPTLITWPTELFDAHGLFSANKWTPGILGKYYLSCVVNLTTAASTGTGNLSIYKNGSLLHKGPNMHASTTNGIGVTVNAIVSVDVSTDYFEIFIEQGFVNPATVDGAATKTWFTGIMID